MNIQQERQRRANTIRWLEKHGAVEGKDWRWGTLDEWDRPGVIDDSITVGAIERLVPKDKTALPIMIRSSGVRLIGGPMLASMMQSGKFPAEMPFAIWYPGGPPLIGDSDDGHG